MVCKKLKEGANIMKKETEKIIEKITYKHDRQSINHREIYTYKNLRIKLELESDSYDFQCYARAYVLDGLSWNLIYSIPHSEMKTPSKLTYIRNYAIKPSDAEIQFKADVERLKKYIREIL